MYTQTGKYGGDISLDELLCRKFGPPHDTIGEVSRFCKKCRAPLPNFRTAIWSLPKILIVHLSRNKSIGVKVETRVDFPLNSFDLSNRVSGPRNGTSLYDLKGVTEHGGAGQSYYSGQGHFTAKVKSPKGESWRVANDTTVQECKQADIVTSAACVLYYERRGY